MKWAPQGLDRETNSKVRNVLMDSSLKVMSVVLEGMRRKEECLVNKVVWEMNKVPEEETNEVRIKVNEVVEKTRI